MTYQEIDLPVTGTPISVADFGAKVKADLEYLRDMGGGSNPLPLHIASAQAPLSGLTAAAIEVSQSGAATVKPQFYKLLFDGAADEGRMWNFAIPSGYIDTPKLIIQFHLATADTAARTVIFNAQIAAVSNGDATLSAKEFAAANAGNTAIAGTAYVNEQQVITLTNADGLAANDQVCLVLWRNADADTCVRDAIVTYVGFSYNV